MTNEFESSASALRSQSPLPGASNDDRYSSSPAHQVNEIEDQDSKKDELNNTLLLMQEFMVKQGVINSTMTPRDLQKFLRQERLRDKDASLVKPAETIAANQEKRTAPRSIQEKVNKGKAKQIKRSDNVSEVTIYRRAVKQTTPLEISKISKQINDLVTSARNNITEVQHSKDMRKSSSSEEMDTSDEAPGYDTELLKRFNDHAIIVDQITPEDEQQPDTTQDMQIT